MSVAMTMGAIAQEPVKVQMMHVEQNPNIVAFYDDIAARFEAEHPGVDVELQFLESQSYKQKLPTLLQSPERPDIIYGWGGGVLAEQAKAGVLENLTPAFDAGWGERFTPAALEAFTVDGQIYGMPSSLSAQGFWYNKALFEQAGVDATQLTTWDDFLSAVQKLKDAGIVPIATGGSDKWPLHLYWCNLALRSGGKAAFDAAVKGEGDGFASPTFVQAGTLFAELAQLDPFQPGYLAATYPQSAGQFGDGGAAMILMSNHIITSMPANAANKVGIPDEDLGWFPFPVVEGGAGDPRDVLAGFNGWMVTAGAPKEATEFLEFFSEPENQRVAAEQGFYIPSELGTAESIQHPIVRLLAENLANATYIQPGYDQLLGPSVGQVVNDISADLAAGLIGPEEAAQTVQDAWAQEN
jgi:raffinose/stachyose/melibiose transport system substrate-binding protein